MRVVATLPDELPALEKLEQRGRENGLEGIRRLTPEEIREFEPHAAGIAGRGLALDVTDAAACEAALGDIEKSLGAVTILVNNAGITRDNLAMRMKDAEWDDVLDTNLKSVFRMSRLVMRGQRGARLRGKPWNRSCLPPRSEQPLW